MPNGNLTATEPGPDTAAVTVDTIPLRIWAIEDERRILTVPPEERVVRVKLWDR